MHMGTATPWWGTVVVALSGLLGVLWTVWRSGKREDRSRSAERVMRLLDIRSELYFKYLRALDIYVKGLIDGLDDAVENPEFVETFDELRDLNERITVFASDVVLFIHDSVRHSVSKLAILDEQGASSEERAKVKQGLDWAIAQFKQAVRDEFGIEGLDSPELRYRIEKFRERLEMKSLRSKLKRFFVRADAADG